MKIEEEPDVIYGRFLEAGHTAGYSFERACKAFDWLLEEGRWKSVGKGFEDIEEFIKTIDFSEFKVTAERRKEIAKKLSDLKTEEGEKVVSQRAIAGVLGVNERTVRRDLDTAANAAPESEKQLENNRKANRDAAFAASPALPTVKDAFKADNDRVKQENKGAKRAEKEQELAERTQATNAALKSSDKVYNVIYADPPWKFQPFSQETGMDRAPDNHYPTESTEVIEGMVPPSAKDAVLFLWATVPMLMDALDVVDAWGFQYKSHWVWVKDRMGTGYWGRNQHELLLIATKGDVPAPAPSDVPSTVLNAKLAAHSAKPGEFYERIERLYPTLPKLEMFARQARPGWDAWGNEVESEAA